MDDYNVLTNLALAASIGLYSLVAYSHTKGAVARCIKDLEKLGLSVEANEVYVVSQPLSFQTKIVTIYPNKVVVSSLYKRGRFIHTDFDVDSTEEINIWSGYLELVPKNKISKSSDMTARFAGDSEFGLRCIQLGGKVGPLNWARNGRRTATLFKEKLVSAGFKLSEHKPVRRSGAYRALGIVAVLLLVLVFGMLIFGQ